ncbi:hypothetical protein L207DRAFT_641711 [Hyaloscypha variabilis F]|uniref:C2H2-type domain-containing protein n=1 Tax=Hyaloscypha variabilis (strain UAMH 11265 / GT02V1 / F) TaxID=1149755 RepID=A0A2J6QW02_HYAVF|nr:hypothetical protein L207DRAFT_641711 [Hyaloscypha variabilis F]
MYRSPIARPRSPLLGLAACTIPCEIIASRRIQEASLGFAYCHDTPGSAAGDMEASPSRNGKPRLEQTTLMPCSPPSWFTFFELNFNLQPNLRALSNLAFGGGLQHHFEHRDDSLPVWNNNTTFTDRLGSTPQFCNTSALHSGDNSLYSDFSAGFASGSYIGDRSIYLPASLDELQNPAVFQPFGITDHSANPSNEIYLSSFGAPLHQLQQYFFEPVNTYSTVSHAPVVHYSHPIPPVDDVPYLQNALGNFNFNPSPHLDTARPSITVQSPSVPLPSPIIFNSNQLHLSAQRTQTPLDGSQSPAQSLSSTDEIHCTWLSCNKKFPSIHTYNQHSKTHTKPFQCPFCQARHDSKRHRDRHINERHRNTERYYCRVPTCGRSLAGGGEAFPRPENCRRHMRDVHRFSTEQAMICDMDEETRRIRAGRKVGRRKGG